MQIKFFKALWGMEHLPLSDAFKQIKQAGYDGVEMGPRWLTPAQGQDLPVLLQDYDLLLIAQQYTWENSLEAHLQSAEEQFRVNATLKPLFINSQTGKDHFTFAQNTQFIKLLATLSQETGIPVVHEIHRGRFNFCTTAILPYLEVFPDLRFCADFSHWVCVAESYLEDQAEIVNLAINRADHIHARVGYHQGPQITDPRVPEWQETLQHHLNWWDAVVNLKRSQGAELLTITPEFGPFPYMPILPFTKQPLTDLWEVNLYMKDLLQARYLHN